MIKEGIIGRLNDMSLFFWKLGIWFYTRGPFSLFILLIIVTIILHETKILSKEQINYFLASGAGIVIALLTYFLNKTKINLELFEKRFQIYEKCRTAIGLVVAKASIDYNSAVGLLKKSDYEIKFFFGNDVIQYVDDLYRKCIELEYLRNELSDQVKYPANSPERSEVTEKQMEILIFFGKQIDILPKKFEKYLSFKHMY